MKYLVTEQGNYNRDRNPMRFGDVIYVVEISIRKEKMYEVFCWTMSFN